MKIHCRTTFDITATGVTSSSSRNRMPFVDRAGQTVNDEAQWNRSRNQQRNWETFKQIISLRTLPVDIVEPVRVDSDGMSVWYFEFDVDHIETLGLGFEHLEQDCKSVPMLVNLTETTKEFAFLEPGINVWFDVAIT